MIETKNLTFQYNKKTEAVKDISLKIPKGSWVSIIGHNGSGKSTFAKLLVGLLEADSGEIYINDELITKENLTNLRKQIGIVFQNPDNQFVGVTVKYDIAFGLENQQLSSKEIKRLVEEYATYVGMEEFLDKEPHNLSGGQKQRVAIAGALAMQQEVLILDEATSMLDPKGTKDIVELIRKVNQEMNKTVITITHDLSLANKSDHIFVLREGELILEGNPKEVFKEEELLKSSHLEIPLTLSVYNEIAKDENADERLVEALWEFNSKQ